MTDTTFEQLNLEGFIRKAIEDLKFSAPSAIQAEAIPHIMNNEDIIGMAPTGSGKTFAFGIPVLQKIDKNSKNVQALVLCPTRELTVQVHREFEKLTKYEEDITCVSIYGGQRIDKQFAALKRNPQVIIATPGRLMDHLRQGSLTLKNVKFAVLDEADEMLDMGFRDDIHEILEQTDSERQTILFSATMEKDIMMLAKKFQKTPFIVDVIDNLQNAPDIDQYYLQVAEKDKPEAITRLLARHNLKLALVFCNTKSNVDSLVETLKVRGFAAEAMHGDMNQMQRERVINGFRKGSVKILVATDVAGRGIDVKNVEAVFNHDLPRDDEDYIHRIGRTGRAGTFGRAFTLVSGRQINSLKRIERMNGIKINHCECPTVEQIDAAQFENYIGDIQNILEKSDLTDIRKKISAIATDKASQLDIACALYKILSEKENSKINRHKVFEEAEEGEYFERRRGGRGSFNGKSRSGGGNKFRGDRKSKFGPKSEKFGKPSGGGNFSPRKKTQRHK